MGELDSLERRTRAAVAVDFSRLARQTDKDSSFTTRTDVSRRQNQHGMRADFQVAHGRVI